MLLECTSDEFKPTSKYPNKPSLFHFEKSLTGVFETINSVLSERYGAVKTSGKVDECVVLGLKCLNSLLSWIQLSDAVSLPLLETIFGYATLPIGFELESRRVEEVNELGSLAVQCLFEILSKVYVPDSFIKLLDTVLVESYKLLEQLGTVTANVPAGSNDLNSSALSSTLDDSFMEKLLNYYSVVVTNQLDRLLSNRSFSFMSFLRAFFQFTFSITDLDHYCSCLEVWNFILESILERAVEPDRNKAEVELMCATYKDALISLGNTLCQKIQFKSNGPYLSGLDDTDEYGDEEGTGQTEYEFYVSCNINCISKIAELYPADVITSLYPHLISLSESYMSSHHWWNQNNENINSLNVDQSGGEGSDSKLLVLQRSSEEARYLLYQIRDMETTIFLFSSFSSIFCNHFASTFEACLTLIDKLHTICLYGITYQLFMNDKYLSSLQKQCFRALGSYAYWIRLYCCEYGERKEVQDLVSSVVELMLTVLVREVPVSLMEATAETLFCFSIVIRHANFGKLESVSKFGLDYPTVCGGFPLGVREKVFKSLTLFAVLPWHGVTDSEQQWDSRKIFSENFCAKLTGPLFNLMASISADDCRIYNDHSVMKIVTETYSILSHIISSVSSEGKVPKVIVFQSIKHSIEPSLKLFQVYVNNPNIMTVLLRYYTNLFETLRLQLGSQDAQTIISSSFSHFFTPEIIAKAMTDDSQALAANMVLNFLKILKLIVDEHSQVFRAFLGTIIEMSIEQIYPMIKQAVATPNGGFGNMGNLGLDIYLEYFSLLYGILLNHFRFFHPRIDSVSDSELCIRQKFFVNIISVSI